MGSSKNILRKFQFFTDGAMTGTTTLTSPVTNIQFLDNIGVQLHFTGTPTGTFQVQVSADHYEDSQKNVIVQGTFVPVTLSPSPVASGADGDIYIDLNQPSAPWIRIVYTNASGTGILQGFLTAKSVGG